jgi:hypothetical protein
MAEGAEMTVEAVQKFPRSIDLMRAFFDEPVASSVHPIRAQS